MNIINEEEAKIIEYINDPLYSVEFLSEWINRNDFIDTNAIAALQAMSAKGFYFCVQSLAKREDLKKDTKGLSLTNKRTYEEANTYYCNQIKQEYQNINLYSGDLPIEIHNQTTTLLDTLDRLAEFEIAGWNVDHDAEILERADKHIEKLRGLYLKPEGETQL